MVVGEEVIRSDGQWRFAAAMAVTAVEHRTEFEQPQLVYNIEVAQAHTYFVGKWMWWVHNAGACSKKLIRETEELAEKLVVKVKPADKIDRDLLHPPTTHGNAPTFKKDGTPVEIHHVGQAREGPFKEMHWEDHRGKGNDKINHPDKHKPSKVDRKEFNDAKRDYWKKEFPKK